MRKTLDDMTPSEIWDGWCGSASPKSDEGHFDDLADAIAYVRDRMSDWHNEPLDDDRVIGDMTEKEIESVAQKILFYSQSNR